MGEKTLSLKSKIERDGVLAHENEIHDQSIGFEMARMKQEFREKLIISSISGLALNQLDRPGRVAQNAILLADAVIAELGWK